VLIVPVVLIRSVNFNTLGDIESLIDQKWTDFRSKVTFMLKKLR